VAGFCEQGNETSGPIKKAGYCLTGRVTLKFSNNVLHHGVSKGEMRNAWKILVRKPV
jgi:hypothetical protein